MKKVIGIILLIFISIFLFSCDPDPYVGKRPIDFSNSIWICQQTTYMYIEYNENNELEEAYIFQENSVSISLVYSSLDNKVVILDDEGNILFRCNAEYLENECVLTVYESNLDEVNVADIFILIHTNTE